MPDASYLSLMGPRFLLRHPYGKRSDPISSFALEEFTREDGLRGMLWGHPGLLALCVLGVHGGQLTINDLAFHHYVDADGDSVALPCTERLVNTNAATLLRDYGISAVMAHKGEALVRLSGVEAINGDGLAGSNTAGRKAPSDSRFALRSKPEGDGKVAVDWTPAQRSGGTVSVSAPMQRLAQDEEAPAAEAAAAAVEDSGSGDAELDALLASLGADEAAAEAPPEPAPAGEEPAMDPDLEALLASLG